jgi:hypothetical protein
MTEIWLGVIAVSVLLMAIIQVAGIVMAARVARRVDRVADRVEQGVDRVMTSVEGITGEAARAASGVTSLFSFFRRAAAKDPKESRTASDADDPMFVG